MFRCGGTSWWASCAHRVDTSSGRFMRCRPDAGAASPWQRLGDHDRRETVGFTGGIGDHASSTRHRPEGRVLAHQGGVNRSRRAGSLFLLVDAHNPGSGTASGDNHRSRAGVVARVEDAALQSRRVGADIVEKERGTTDR